MKTVGTECRPEKHKYSNMTSSLLGNLKVGRCNANLLEQILNLVTKATNEMPPHLQPHVLHLLVAVLHSRGLGEGGGGGGRGEEGAGGEGGGGREEGRGRGGGRGGGEGRQESHTTSH